MSVENIFKRYKGYYLTQNKYDRNPSRNAHKKTRYITFVKIERSYGAKNTNVNQKEAFFVKQDAQNVYT